MKKLNVLMIKRITWGLITLLMLAGCSLNNPFLQTEEPIPPVPEKPEELPPPPPEPIHVESITSDVTKVTREIGGDYRIVYKILPENADDKSVVIKIESMTPEKEGETVVSLKEKDGVVYALALGKAVVSITTNDGNKVAKINFTVIPKDPDTVDVEKITIEGIDWIYDDGERKPLTAIVEPSNATDKSLRWSIVGEENIAKIESQDASGSGISIWREGEVTEETVVTVRVESSYKSAIFAEKKVTIKHKPRPEIFITSPNGGEEFTFKTDTTITWTTKDVESDKVKVELVDTLTEAKYVISEDAENSGSCYWYIDQNVGFNVGENYKIRITTIPNADESADVVVSDRSDEVFKLKKIVPTIELTSPTSRGKDENGNEKDNYFYLYDTINMNIRWLSTDMPDDKVAIYLVKQNGDNTNDFTQVAKIVENADNNGLFIWNLGKFVLDSKISLDELADENSTYKIKIENLTYNDTLSAEEYEKNKVESISDVTFSLEKVDNPFLKFLAPTGKKLYIGTQNDITWEGVGFNNDVKIELVPEATSVSNYTIAERTENDGCFEWTISEDIMEGGAFDLSTKYKIRITVLDETQFRYLSGDRQGSLIDRMIDKDGNPITDKDGNEIVLENPGTLVAEGENYLEAILAPNVYFLLDDSGSMATSNRIGTLKKRMDNAAVALAKNFNIGIMSLNNTMKELPLKKGWTADDIRSSYAALKASGVTPTGPSLEKILNNKKYEMEDDIYKEYRRKAVVVITDGQPQDGSGTTQGFLDSFKNAVTKSSLLAGNGIPVFYMGINATGSLADKLQDMAVAGGTDNPKDESTPHKNWYPIDQDNQFEAALNEIMYGDLEVAGSMVEYEIDCGTPDSGNSIYFFGDHLLLGGTTSPSSASGLLKGTFENGKYYIKIGKQDNMTFDWGVVQTDSKGNILKIEDGLHTSDETSPIFNGWKDVVITIRVDKSLGYNAIYYWNCSNTISYPNLGSGETAWNNRKQMTSDGNDYIFEFKGATSVNLLITKSTSDGSKLCGSDMKASSPGTWRVTSSGIKKEN